MDEIYENIRRLSEKTVGKCAEHGLKVSSAESCTGGMISAAITSVSGSSSVIELGVCSYSNRIKQDVLRVSEQTLGKFSEYSIQCVKEMLLGALKLSGADFTVATSGVAGPAGGTEENPVGTVYIGVCGKGHIKIEKHVFDDQGRDYIRAAVTEKALNMLLDIINICI